MTHLSLDAVRIATDNVRRDAADVAELCNRAGRPELSPEFIREGLTADSVRRRLAPPAAQPVKQPAAGNGAGFDLAMIERAIAEKRTVQ